VRCVEQLHVPQAADGALLPIRPEYHATKLLLVQGAYGSAIGHERERAGERQSLPLRYVI
jgi:hypothetical protein